MASIESELRIVEKETLAASDLEIKLERKVVDHLKLVYCDSIGCMLSGRKGCLVLTPSEMRKAFFIRGQCEFAAIEDPDDANYVQPGIVIRRKFLAEGNSKTLVEHIEEIADLKLVK